MAFKYSFNMLVYWGEPIEKGIERLVRFGYDGVEFVGEPTAHDPVKIKESLKKYHINAAAICSIYNAERDLVSPDIQVRKNAVTYVKDVAKMAHDIGAGVIIIAPTACMKTNSEIPREQELAWLIPSLQEAADFAQGWGVRLALEPWNRYETYFLNRCEQALELQQKINRPNVGIWLDTFHMNLEETSIPAAIRMAGKNLFHLHLADSNRAAPGRGHLDFKPILQAIKDIQYNGYLSMEILPAAADPFGVLKKGGGKEFYDQYTKESIEYLKSIALG